MSMLGRFLRRIFGASAQAGARQDATMLRIPYEELSALIPDTAPMTRPIPLMDGGVMEPLAGKWSRLGDAIRKNPGVKADAGDFETLQRELDTICTAIQEQTSGNAPPAFLELPKAPFEQILTRHGFFFQAAENYGAMAWQRAPNAIPFPAERTPRMLIINGNMTFTPDKTDYPEIIESLHGFSKNMDAFAQKHGLQPARPALPDTSPFTPYLPL